MMDLQEMIRCAQVRNPYGGDEKLFYVKVSDAEKLLKRVAEQQERIADLEAEAERLWAVVDALPTTKDGVTIMLDMTVYVMTETGVRARHVCGLDQFGVRVPPHEYSARTEIGYDECYSTREAAETAGAK